MGNSSENSAAKELAGLRAEVDSLRGQLSQLGDLGGRIASSLDLPTVLQEVVDAACRLTGARYGAVVVFDDSGHVREFVTHGITAEERERIGSPPAGTGILGWLRELRASQRVKDLPQHPHFVGFPPNHPPMSSFLGIPILDGHQPLGNLYLTEREDGQEFTADDESLMVHFAAQAATAIGNAQRFRREQESRADAEAARRELEAERTRLETVVNTSPAGVFVAEAESGEVVLVNREAQRLLGISMRPGDKLERYVQAVRYRRTDGREFEADELPLQRALRHGENARAVEVRLDLPDGRSIPTLVNASPIYSADNEITGAIAVIQDMTPLEDMEKLQSEFLGMVSHELRTPLAAIKGSAATVLTSQSPFDEREMREFFQIIDEQADRLRDLVHNLLDITRIEAGAMTVSLRPLDLRDVVTEARKTFIQGGGAQEVVIRAPDDLPTVNADLHRTAQVLHNLLTNAGKFSPEAAPITIELKYDADFVKVSVRDKGRGIEADKLPYVFKTFLQVRDPGNRGLSRKGLGLAICKGIVEAHGGRIWAESDDDGEGAVFTFTLPVAAEAASPPESDTSRRADANPCGRRRATGASLSPEFSKQRRIPGGCDQRPFRGRRAHRDG